MEPFEPPLDPPLYCGTIAVLHNLQYMHILTLISALWLGTILIFKFHYIVLVTVNCKL